MRKSAKRGIAAALTAAMMTQITAVQLAFAADAADRALNPADYIELSVPDEMQDGNNYVFIKESSYTVSEKSGDKLYIPVQRTGDIGSEAEITVKVIDVTATKGENYDVEVYKDEAEETIPLSDETIGDLIENSEYRTEAELPDPEEFGKALYDAGGAEVFNTDGEKVGDLKAYERDENGNSIKPAEDSQAAPKAELSEQTAPDAEPTEETAEQAVNTDGTGTLGLRAARELYTGTASDRQEMEVPESMGAFGGTDSAGGNSVNMVSDEFPGRELRLHFDADEEAKFLVLTPRYSSAADGDCQVTFLLKNPSPNLVFHESTGPCTVNIKDEDEPEPVYIGMASETAVAKDGVATITVNRQGRINAVAGVLVTSYEGTAKQDTDYGGVGAKLYFAMGLSERTIRLPVYHGAETKDFYVTITPLNGENITAATTRVIIPAGSVSDEKVEKASLMAADAKYGELISLTEYGFSNFGHDKRFASNTRYHMGTKADKEGDVAGINVRLPDYYGYFYDGLRFEFDTYISYCKGSVMVEMSKYKGMTALWEQTYGDDDGSFSNQTLNYWYDEPQAPYSSRFWVKNRDNEGTVFVDDYIDADMSVRPILRKFNIEVMEPKALEFKGMTEAQVMSEYETYIVNDKLESRFSVWSGDSFSVSRLGASEMARLVGLEAVKYEDGKEVTYRIADVDGTSSTAVVEMNRDLVNYLAKNDYFSWFKDGQPGKDSVNYVFYGATTGILKVRPVFDYVNEVKVEIPENPYGTLKCGDEVLTPGEHTFHYGDRLTFTTQMSETGTKAGLIPSGFSYKAKQSRAGDTAREAVETYINGSNQESIPLIYNYYSIEPTFTEEHNQVVVKVSDSDLDYFADGFGVFESSHERWQADGYTYIRISNDVPSNVIYELYAAAKDENTVPVWTLANDSNTYSGQSFYLTSGPKASENLVTLTADRTQNHAWYELSGSIYTSTLNLSTGHSATDMIAAKGAAVTAGFAFAETGKANDSDGSFRLPIMQLAGGSVMRYTVTYNGNVNVCEVKIPPASAPKNKAVYQRIVNRTEVIPDDQLAPGQQPGTTRTVTVPETVETVAIPVSINAVKADSWPHNGVHFKDVDVKLDGYITRAVDNVEMNGKELSISVKLDPGSEYIYGDQTLKENIKDVRLYFKSSVTGQEKGSFSINDPYYIRGTEEFKQNKNGIEIVWDPETYTATLKIKQFKPDKQEIYTYGDILMAQVTTDKKVGLAAVGDNVMEYMPVSTGIAVIADQDYVPQSFNYSIEDMADMLDVSEPDNIDDDGKLMDEEKRASYGKFPFLGELKVVVKCFSVLSSVVSPETAKIINDLSSMGKNGTAQDPGTNVYPFRKQPISIAIVIDETPYGGTRVMLAASIAVGEGKPYESMSNPYESKGAVGYYFGTRRNTGGSSSQSLDDTTDAFNMANTHIPGQKEMQSIFGGPYWDIVIYFGIYIDFGYIQVEKTDGSGQYELSHDAVFMGAGGFIGGSAEVGYTQYIVILGIPFFADLNGKVDLKLFLGASADPNKTLDHFQQTDELSGQDYGLNVEFHGTASATLTIGVGIYKVLSVHVSGGVAFEAGYGSEMAAWYPNIGENWGYGLDATFSGAIDVVFTTIELYSFSWPTGVGYGWMLYMQEVRRGNNLITFIEKALNNGKGTPAVREICARRVEELKGMIDSNSANTDTLTEAVKSLREYAYDNDIITWTENNRVKMNKQGGIVGGAMDAVMLEADEEQENSTFFHTRDHVGANWVGGKDASLSSAFSQVSTDVLEEDSLSHPSSRIQPLGGNKFLMVYLDDDTARERLQASTLKYTIYDANSGTWTDPVIVQDDGTADSKPDLIEADESLILSWASIPKEKYEALKESARNAIKEAAAKEGNASEPTDEDVQTYLESDPTLTMNIMEIFSVRIDRTLGSCTFGSIEQLTDDNYYDDYPAAVYDWQTGDYIVSYYKTEQQAEKYNSASDKLMDMISYSPDPKKTYTTMCYMLYNNQTDIPDADGNTHEAGWARDYLFSGESNMDADGRRSYLDLMQGQRMIVPPITDDNGKVIVTDPAFGDMVSEYVSDGLAGFAFTVDMDFDLKTSEDRMLYAHTYDFDTHTMSRPVKVAGESTEERYEGGKRIITKTPVEVSVPKLAHKDSDTLLFWRQGSDEIRYLNLTELCAGRYVEPLRVDIASATTDPEINFAEYQVLTDTNDNLYVIWTDVEDTDSEDSTAYPVSQEIYATAMISEEETVRHGSGGTETEEDGTPIIVDGEETEYTITHARWSKPYRLTRSNKFNDNIALTTDDEGGLIIVHNQYEKQQAENDEKMMELVREGKVGITERNGEKYYLGSSWYDSPSSLMVTRCDAVGSVEVTDFAFSDDHPYPGEKVVVTPLIENTGLTSADGVEAEFWLCKDGTRIGDVLSTVESEERFPVNDAATAPFVWEIPAEGVDGCSIRAVVKEKKKDGSCYDPIETDSKVFTAEPTYTVSIDSIKQEGDDFRMVYHVYNSGNKTSEEGTKVNLELVGLYGDLRDKYGVDDPLLWSADLPETVARGTEIGSESVTIPKSVFNFCGFDAVRLYVTDKDGNRLASTNHVYVSMEEPMNIKLNNGNDVEMSVGQTKQAALSYDSTALVDMNMEANGSVVYSVEDPSVASVDNSGNVKALAEGETTVKAILLPSGRTAETKLSVTLNEADPEITNAQKEGESAVITLENAASKSVQATAAIYDEQGRLLGVSRKAVTATGDSEDISIPLGSHSGAAKIRLMVWTDEMTPLTNAVEIPAAN